MGVEQVTHGVKRQGERWENSFMSSKLVSSYAEESHWVPGVNPGVSIVFSGFLPFSEKRDESEVACCGVACWQFGS
jgi:hypothetical protein